MSSLSNLPLNAIGDICNFLPDKSILQLRTVCKSINNFVCSLLSIRETVVDNIRFHGESVSFTIHFSERNMLLWKLCLLYSLSNLKFLSPFTILKMVSSTEVQINMPPGEMRKILPFVKSLIPHATFYHLWITGIMSPEIMLVYSHFTEGKSLKTVSLDYSLSDPENCQSAIKLLQNIETEYLSLDLYCEITKSTIDLILACANMPGRQTIRMNDALFPKKVEIIPFIQEILGRKCSNLRYVNSRSIMSQEQVEKLIQVFHHMNKKLFFATFSEISNGPQSYRRVGAYNTRVPHENMFDDLPNLPLNAIATLCFFLPERSILELRQAEEQHIRLIFHLRQHFFSWALCLLYVLKQQRLDSDKSLNLETVNKIIYLKLTPEELARILECLKQFTILSKFHLLRTEGNIQPEIIDAYTELIKEKYIRAVFLHKFELSPSNSCSWLKLLREIRTDFVHVDVQSIANKQSVEFLTEVAHLVNEITIVVGHSCKSSASCNLSLARQILSRKCDSLALRNNSFRISSSQAENMLQFVHRLEKKVHFNTHVDDSFGKYRVSQFGTYVFRVNAQMALIRHIDWKT